MRIKPIEERGGTQRLGLVCTGQNLSEHATLLGGLSNSVGLKGLPYADWVALWTLK